MTRKKRFRRPWDLQKYLQKKYYADEVPDIEEIANIISRIKIGKIDRKLQTLRARALFAVYYLSACRCSEIVAKATGKPSGFQGLRRGHIKKVYVNDKPFMQIRAKNRKHRTRRTKQLLCPIEFEGKIVKHLVRYLKLFKDNKSRLFPFKNKRAIQIIRESTGFNPHFIRHIRATHLVSIYDFNEQMLVRFMGWTDARPAKAYMELKTRDFARAFYKR